MRTQMLDQNETISKLVILLLPGIAVLSFVLLYTQVPFRGAVVGRPCSAWGFAVQPFRQLERNLVRIVPWPRCPGRSTTAASLIRPGRDRRSLDQVVLPQAMPAASLLLRSRECTSLCDKLPISTDWFNPRIAHQYYCSSEAVYQPPDSVSWTRCELTVSVLATLREVQHDHHNHT